MFSSLVTKHINNRQKINLLGLHDCGYNAAENYNKWRNKLIFLTAISILPISNQSSFRVLFDKIPSVIFYKCKKT